MAFSDLLTARQKAAFAILNQDPDVWIQSQIREIVRMAMDVRTRLSTDKLAALPENVKTTIETTIDDEYKKVNP